MAMLNVDYSDLDYEDMAVSIGLKSKHIPMLIDSFLDETQEILKALTIAVDLNDFLAIKLNAHSIKGSSGNLKFTEIYDMTREMELSAITANTNFDYHSSLRAIKAGIATIPR